MHSVAIAPSQPPTRSTAAAPKILNSAYTNTSTVCKYVEDRRCTFNKSCKGRGFELVTYGQYNNIGMFGFTAHFADDVVFINGKEYCSNEILTTCLNTITIDFRNVDAELCSLKSAAQIKGSEKDHSRVDDAVQQAQQLFFRIGSILKKIPPYNKDTELIARLDSPMLLDCVRDTDGVCFTELDDSTTLTRKINKEILILFDQFVA